MKMLQFLGKKSPDPRHQRSSPGPRWRSHVPTLFAMDVPYTLSIVYICCIIVIIVCRRLWVLYALASFGILVVLS